MRFGCGLLWFDVLGVLPRASFRSLEELMKALERKVQVPGDR